MTVECPEFIIYTGPMFASKTTRLLQDLDRLQRQGKRVIAFKPLLDDRYAEDQIISHPGERWPARPVAAGAGILKSLTADEETYDVVAVDEAFMIPGVAAVLKWLYAQGVTIIVASIDMSFQCTPFIEVGAMLPFATRVEKLTAICDVCPSEARYTYKKIDDDKEIAVGGNELYAPRCFKHHPYVADAFTGE